MDSKATFDASMKPLGKRLEVMRKKNEIILLQNEILSLGSELRELEMRDEQVHAEESRDEIPCQTYFLEEGVMSQYASRQIYIYKLK